MTVKGFRTAPESPVVKARAKSIATILEHWDTLTSPLNGPGGVRGDGESVQLLPPDYNQAVREVERLYKLMRTTAGRYGSWLDVPKTGPHGRAERVYVEGRVTELHWHLAEWYIRSTVKVSYLPRHTKHHGKKVLLLNADRSPQLFPVRVVCRHPGVQETLAHTGVSWMSAEWGLSREPFLPKELAA